MIRTTAAATKAMTQKVPAANNVSALCVTGSRVKRLVLLRRMAKPNSTPTRPSPSMSANQPATTRKVSSIALRSSASAEAPGPELGAAAMPLSPASA